MHIMIHLPETPIATYAPTVVSLAPHALSKFSFRRNVVQKAKQKKEEAQQKKRFTF